MNIEQIKKLTPSYQLMESTEHIAESLVKKWKGTGLLGKLTGRKMENMSKLLS